MDRTAKQGDTIKVHYTGRFDTGDEFDSSAGNDPLVFTIGSKEVIQGFEEAFLGMSQGEKKTISIDPEDGYGPYNDNLVIEMPHAFFPEDITPEPGMQLKLVDDNEQEVQVMVSEIKEEAVTLDANHPLAGKTLIFDVELIDIV